ncbi:hypothetical protein ACFLZH_02710 [Patescibacteria group bacterium]
METKTPRLDNTIKRVKAKGSKLKLELLMPFPEVETIKNRLLSALKEDTLTKEDIESAISTLPVIGISREKFEERIVESLIINERGKFNALIGE